MQPFIFMMRNIGNLFFNFIGIILCLVGGLCLFFMHYNGLSYGIALMGMDTQPLSMDPLIGPLFQVILPKVNYTHGLGMSVVFALMAGTLICFHEAHSIIQLWISRKQYQRQNDIESVDLANQQIILNATLFVLFLIPTIAIFWWDLNLYKFRLLAGAIGADTPELARGLASMTEQMSNNGNLWVWDTLSIGAQGYIALVVVVSFSFEYVLARFSDNFTKLMTNFELMVNGNSADASQPIFYGYDHSGMPVYEENQPISYDTAGKPVDSSNQESTSLPTSEQEDEPLFSSEKLKSKDSIQTESVCKKSGADMGSEDSIEYEVVGGQPGQKITMDEAKANPGSYWIDPDTQQIWDIDYRKLLFGEGRKKRAA